MVEVTPAVSIVIPMYNVEEFVGECLQSLLGQTFQDFEAICVNDGSTDDTLAVAQRVVGDDERFRFFTLENGGQSRARNFGIDQARGAYLMFLDADDYFAPHTIARAYEVAQADDLDYLDFTAHTFYESERARELRNEDYYETRPSIPGVMTGPELFVQYQRHVEYHCAPWLHFVKRSLVDDAGLRFAEGIIHEDELFSPLLIAQAKRARYLNEVLYLRRMREGSSITTTQGMRSTVFMLQAAEGLHTWLRENWQNYDEDFIDAMAQRVHELRGLAVGYARQASPDDLAEHVAGLHGDDLIDFDLTIVGGLDDARKLDELLHDERLYYLRQAWHGARDLAGKATRRDGGDGGEGDDSPSKICDESDEATGWPFATSDEDSESAGEPPAIGEGDGAADEIEGFPFSSLQGSASTAAPHRATPRVSVIVAAHNEEAHIAECVASMQAQTLDDFELICVDDGSTDSTPEIVERLAAEDPRICLIRQAHAGPGEARTAGLAAARGEFVYCLDADDFAQRDLLKTCVEALDETGADMALFAFRCYNDKAGRAFPAQWGMNAVEEYPLYPHGTFNWRTNPNTFFEAVRNIPWNKVVRRSVIVENDIEFLPIYLTEDALYSLPAAVCAKSIARIARPLMFHREYTGTNLMSDRGAHPFDYLDAFEALRAWLQERGVYGELRVAWQTWLVDAIHYAMPRYANIDAFAAAYERLTADDLRAFDLAELDPDLIANSYQRRMYEALRTGSREQFLLTCANCGFEELEEEICDWQRWQTPSGAALASVKEKLRTGSGPVSGAARALRAKM